MLYGISTYSYKGVEARQGLMAQVLFDGLYPESTNQQGAKGKSRWLVFPSSCKEGHNLWWGIAWWCQWDFPCSQFLQLSCECWSWTWWSGNMATVCPSWHKLVTPLLPVNYGSCCANWPPPPWLAAGGYVQKLFESGLSGDLMPHKFREWWYLALTMMCLIGWLSCILYCYKSASAGNWIPPMLPDVFVDNDGGEAYPGSY